MKNSGLGRGDRGLSHLRNSFCSSRCPVVTTAQVTNNRYKRYYYERFLKVSASSAGYYMKVVTSGRQYLQSNTPSSDEEQKSFLVILPRFSASTGNSRRIDPSTDLVTPSFFKTITDCDPVACWTTASYAES